MPKRKVAVTLEAALLEEVDALVGEQRYLNRSHAIESAVHEQLVRLKHSRLAEVCSQLDPAEERTLAEEGLAGDIEDWPEY